MVDFNYPACPYHIGNLFGKRQYEKNEEIYGELKLLGRQYTSYIEMRVSSLNHLHGLIDQTALGIEPLLQSHCTNKAKNKLCDFISTFWHYDIITKKSQKARM